MDDSPSELYDATRASIFISFIRKERRSTSLAHDRMLVWLVLAPLSLGFSKWWESPLPTVFMLLVLFIDALVLRFCSGREMQTLKALASTGDVHSIPILLDTFFHTEFPSHAYLPTVICLSRALPKVTAHEKASFSKQHLDLLHSIIARYSPSQFNSLSLSIKVKHQKHLYRQVPQDVCYSLREGLLKAFVHIGNEETARILKRFIQEDSNSKDKTALQELARISLLKLQERLDRENEATTLLRASSENGDSLLRPVYGHHNEERPETLLRAVTPNREDKEA